MQVPLEIVVKDVAKTDELEQLITEQVDRLEQVHSQLTSCRLAIERPQSHQKQGSPYRVRVVLTVPPGHEIVARKEPGDGDMHQPLDSRVRDAFDAARRQLQELVERQRRDVKSHPDQMASALVDKLFPDEDYGFLKTIDGRDVYFHRNAVLHRDYDRMEIGTAVRYVEQMGDEGPQASTVQIVDKPGARRGEAEEKIEDLE